MIIRKMSRKAIKTYCSMVREAAVLGLPLDDILYETRNFHGESFADEVIKELKQI